MKKCLKNSNALCSLTVIGCPNISVTSFKILFSTSNVAVIMWHILWLKFQTINKVE